MAKAVLDGREFWDSMKGRKVAPCAVCDNWDVGDTTCEAFPGGIPDEIFHFGNRHTKPFKGDHGIQFEPIRGER
jgi:hypothetical protein